MVQKHRSGMALKDSQHPLNYFFVAHRSNQQSPDLNQKTNLDTY